MTDEYSLRPIGHIRSTLRSLDEAPRQGSEGAPDAWLEVDPAFARALLGIGAGTRLRIGPIEAIDGTPVVDIKPVLVDRADA